MAKRFQITIKINNVPSDANELTQYKIIQELVNQYDINLSNAYGVIRLMNILNEIELKNKINNHQ